MNIFKYENIDIDRYKYMYWIVEYKIKYNNSIWMNIYITIYVYASTYI